MTTTKAKKKSIDSLEVYKGYEIPKSTSKEARKVLKKLRKNGVIRFVHDDGPGVTVHNELKKIAGSIGIDFHEPNPYQITLLEEVKEIKLV